MYKILILETTHQTMAAEDMLKKQRIWHDIVPRPKRAKSKCGLAIKIHAEDEKRIKGLFKYKIFED